MSPGLTVRERRPAARPPSLPPLTIPHAVEAEERIIGGAILSSELRQRFAELVGAERIYGADLSPAAQVLFGSRVDLDAAKPLEDADLPAHVLLPDPQVLGRAAMVAVRADVPLLRLVRALTACSFVRWGPAAQRAADEVIEASKARQFMSLLSQAHRLLGTGGTVVEAVELVRPFVEGGGERG